ncbi:MAG TPA: hypothetical protein VHK91_11575 [Flavisolibacter sp.]|jgi:hypothetical protein|nr:hypothetical protein [Flavisolibacter sp.]
MNQFFNHYADLTALLLTVLIPLILTIGLKRRIGRPIRSFPVYFMLFGPIGLLAFIFFHLFENSYRAADAAFNHHFAYNFHFYSLILFGLVVAYLGKLYLQACLDKCYGKRFANRSYLLKVLLVQTATVPLIPVTPIAVLPSILCGISLLAFGFTRRKTIPVSSFAPDVAEASSLQALRVEDNLYEVQ